MNESQGWPKESLLKALQNCAEDLGESPSRSQYKTWNDGIAPNTNAMEQRFGSWNAAKEAADLETYSVGNHPNYRLAGKPRSECWGDEDE